MGVQIPPWEGQFWGGRCAHCEVWGHSAVVCANTGEPTMMPFVLWAEMGRRNHVLDGGLAVLRDIAMATNFGMQFAIIGFVGYNFGCLILGVGFRRQAIW